MKRVLIVSIVIIFPSLLIGRDFSENDDHSTGSGPFVASLAIFLQQADNPDFGDAPASYGSADHNIDGKNYMGSAPDGEHSNQPSPDADADDLTGRDDEDGVIFPEMIPGATVSIPVKINGFAYLNVWIDWNGDGDFMDNGERVISDDIKITGTTWISVNVPANAVISKPTFARFRFGPRSSSKPSYSYSGSANYGEVEDYQIKISCYSPGAPQPGEIIHPTCEVSTGSVVLNGLPGTGTWTLTRLPGSIITSGTGTSTNVSGLNPGTYNFTVTNAGGCTSQLSSDVIINPLSGPQPSVIVTNPEPACSPSTVDLTAAEITAGSTPGLIYTYWANVAGTIPYNTPQKATEGTYYIRGTTVAGCSDI